MDKINICIVVPEIGSGGVEAVLLNFFSHMDCTKYNLDIVAYKVSNEYRKASFEKLGFKIILVPPKKEGLSKSLSAMDSIFKVNKYDVVHAHMTKWNCIPMFLAWKRKIPIRISHSHLAVTPSGFVNKWIFLIQRLIIKCCANRLCACGEDAAISLYGRKTFENGAVSVINNAIDARKFRKNESIRLDVRHELGISDNTFCVGHVGRFHEHKNHAFLIKIFREIHKCIPDSELLLVGDGDLKGIINDEVEKYGLKPYVLFLGVRNDPERIYQAMDVFCMPSLYEGLPVVGIEAQAAGLPCAFSDGISAKVCISSLASRIPLGNSEQQWAEEIIKIKDCKRAVDFPKEYDIEYEVQEWERLYLK